jgi:phospholipase C
LAVATTVLGTAFIGGQPAHAQNLSNIDTVVVIYLENWSFDGLFALYPGANGISRATPAQFIQKDRDGSVLSGLPPVWGGMNSGVAAGAQQAPVNLTQAQTAAYLNTFNHPYTYLALFQSNNNLNNNTPLQYTTRDMFHRFYENQMQINGGKNDMYAAWADSGGLVMAYHDHTNTDQPLWNVAQKFTLADNFFQSVFGGSYLNHQFLICSCAPIYPQVSGVPTNPNPGGTAQAPSQVKTDGFSLVTTTGSPASALNGPPAFVASTILTPQVDPATGQPSSAGVFFTINTSQPPFPPSGNGQTGPNGPQDHVNPLSNTTVPPQTQTTIGDLLDAAGVSYAWYAGGMGDYNTPGTGMTLAPFADQAGTNVPHFQFHHNPFNYYVKFDPAGKFNPVTGAPDASQPAGAYRAAHLKDGGLGGSKFLADVDAGVLPHVTFYKPQGNLNEHPGYTNVSAGDNHVAQVLARLQASPQWGHMLVVVTYDENGGQWDHVAPPKGDFFGPGTRIPALIVSPFAKKGFVDHTQYDTTSILRFITRRWSLPTLPGITRRDNALFSNGHPVMGDLTNALLLP